MTRNNPRSAPRSANRLPADFQTQLLAGLRSGIDSSSPGALLAAVSSLLDVTTGRDVPPERTAEIVRGLTAWDRVETSAGALAMAVLSGDAGLRRCVRRDLADRGHLVPRWLADLHRCTPAERAVEISRPFRDVDELVVGITTPSGHTLTAIVRVDNEFGPRDVGGSLYERPLDAVLGGLHVPDGPDVRIRDIPPADARARIEAALTAIDLDAIFGTTSEWRTLRPLLRWMLTFLPADGDATVPGSMADVEVDDVLDDFLASPWGRPWTRRGLPGPAEAVLGDGLQNALGDPLLWAPHHVRRLLDSEPGSDLLDHLDVRRTPELLRDLIRYGQAERGLRQELTDSSLAAVDRYADAFLAAVRAWDDEAG